MNFRDPLFLLFVPLVFFLLYFFRKKVPASSIEFPSRELVKSAKQTLKITLSKNLILFRASAAALFIIALARPQDISEEIRVRTEGIDIVLAIDSSGSMLAEDFTINGRRQNRLFVVKKVVEDFIRERKNDRIGMIAFAGRAYTVCPLTLDYDWLIRNLERVKIGSIEDGTAIGSAIASSLGRLRDTEAKSKTIILLTDGINNAGKISPLKAAHAAEALGVKIYTIGAGTKGPVPYPVRGPWGGVVYQKVKIEIDENTLKEIAQVTGGMYFRAQDTKSLEDIYREINKLEKTPIEETGYRKYKELFGYFLIPGLLLFMVEIVLSNTILRKLP